jgi:hypothetical protein
MKIEITGVSVSKKGTVWIQAKQVSGEEAPKVGEVHHLEFDPEWTCAAGNEKKVKEKSNDNAEKSQS